MIVEYCGNLLDSRQQTLVCTTNCRGAMGAGLALAFKKRYPDTYRAYREFYRNEWLAVDRLLTAPLNDGSGRQVLFFPTKDDWRQPSRMEWVEQNLRTLASQYHQLDITSLAMPMLGTLNGRLPSEPVYQLIHKTFADHPLYVELYVPF